jgi:hypothetical protein
MPPRTRWYLSGLIAGLALFGACAQARAEDIPLSKRGGVYEIPVEINGVITLNFVLDTGASEVGIPADVFLTLYRAGTIKDADFLPGQTYRLADGSQVNSPRFVLRSLKIGQQRIANVAASISSNIYSPLLLGQSFLEKLGAWGIDSQSQKLVLGRTTRRGEAEQAAIEHQRQAEETEHQRREAEQAAQWKRENLLVAQGMQFIVKRQFLCLNIPDSLVVGSVTLTGASSLSCEDARRTLIADDERKNNCLSPDQKEGQKQWIGTASCPAP